MSAGPTECGSRLTLRANANVESFRSTSEAVCPVIGCRVAQAQAQAQAKSIEAARSDRRMRGA